MNEIKRVSLALLLTIGCSGNQTQSSLKQPLSKSERDIKFSSCLAEKAVMYGAEWCRPCKRQKISLGDGWDYFKHKYVDCSGTELEEKLCDDKGVNFLPTWEIDGNFYEGYKTIERLSKLSGCEY